MRIALGLVVLLVACGPSTRNDDDDNFGNDSGPPPSMCAAMGLPETTVVGTVFAPNGTLPLYNFNVYIPQSAPGPLPDGVQCGQCDSNLPGDPIVQAISDEGGHFTLTGNIPTGTAVPLVITSGKWRKQTTITVNECMQNNVTPEQGRLPKNKSEGDMPQIAVATGGADSTECLIRRLGIDDAEITGQAGTGKVHLYAGLDGVSTFKSGFAGGGTITDATNLWNTVDQLKKYDIVLLSCEGQEDVSNKSTAARANMKTYADLGGRVFASHYHYVWITQGPTPWPSTATFGTPAITSIDQDTIDEVNNPKGTSFATWMMNVMGSTVRDQINLKSGSGRYSMTKVDLTKSQQWVTTADTGANRAPQVYLFETPNEVAEDQRCGKVVFSDMHVSGDTAGGAYPDNCGAGAGSTTLSAQEKAIAFIFFDIASCVGILQ
ncbi:MAG: hypothetical protein QM831_02940 [Kofleriaceae bacterium]